MEKSPHILPKINGYTMDFRLKEFRKFVPGKPPEFISFDSKKGNDLLELYEEQEEWGFIGFNLS